MEERDYSGIRISLATKLEKLTDTIKIDISTGDEITPAAIEFTYPMMFDNEKIHIWSYNIETLLAEKLETVVSRSTLNTRMRDFYDIYIIQEEKAANINIETLRSAVINVARKRGSLILFDNIDEIIEDIFKSSYLRNNWSNYISGNYYVGNLSWDVVLEATINVLKQVAFNMCSRI